MRSQVGTCSLQTQMFNKSPKTFHLFSSALQKVTSFSRFLILYSQEMGNRLEIDSQEFILLGCRDGVCKDQLPQSQGTAPRNRNVQYIYISFGRYLVNPKSSTCRLEISVSRLRFNLLIVSSELIVILNVRVVVSGRPPTQAIMCHSVMPLPKGDR